LLRICRRQV